MAKRATAEEIRTCTYTYIYMCMCVCIHLSIYQEQFLDLREFVAGVAFANTKWRAACSANWIWAHAHAHPQLVLPKSKYVCMYMLPTKRSVAATTHWPKRFAAAAAAASEAVWLWLWLWLWLWQLYWQWRAVWRYNTAIDGNWLTFVLFKFVFACLLLSCNCLEVAVEISAVTAAAAVEATTLYSIALSLLRRCWFRIFDCFPPAVVAVVVVVAVAIVKANQIAYTMNTAFTSTAVFSAIKLPTLCDLVGCISLAPVWRKNFNWNEFRELRKLHSNKFGYTSV